MRLYRAWAN